MGEVLADDDLDPVSEIFHFDNIAFIRAACNIFYDAGNRKAVTVVVQYFGAHMIR